MYIHARPMSEEDVKLFKALGDETRLTIVGFLLKNERCACDFSDMCCKDQTTISRHLKVLSDAGIITSRKRGRNVIYSIRDNGTRDRLLSMGIEQKDFCCNEPTDMKQQKIKNIVKRDYGKIAVEGGSCGCGDGCCGPDVKDPIQISMSLGYEQKDLQTVQGANLGLGCGNPIALGKIKEGDTVLDLGSGAGIDAFLAAQRTGSSGKVIGVDITPEMVKKAKRNAKELGVTNVEFRLGDIEELPVTDSSIDVITSNCVINLAPNKTKVFDEAFRVLKPGGNVFISDMVLLEELTAEQREDEDLISGCVAGAILKDDYLDLMRKAGFRIRKIQEDKEIGKRQYKDLPVESVKIVGNKPRTR